MSIGALIFLFAAVAALYGAYWSLIHQLAGFTLAALLVAFVLAGLFSFSLRAKRR